MEHQTLHDLRLAFRFSVQDLVSNRAGVLSSHQMERLYLTQEREAQAEIKNAAVIGGLSVLLCIGLILYLAATSIWFVAAFFSLPFLSFITTMVILFYRALRERNQNRRRFREGRIVPVRVTKDKLQGTDAFTFLFEKDGICLKLSKPQYDALDLDSLYCFYCWHSPDTKYQTTLSVDVASETAIGMK
jgi:hypothetical protein